MSFNQSRRHKNEDSQFKKSTRSSSFNLQRTSNHSFKQSNGAQHKRESRAGVSSVSSTASTAPRGGENGSHVQPQQNGSASNPTKSTGSLSGDVKKNETSQTTSKTSNEISESKSGIVQNNATSKSTLKTSDANASSTAFKDLRGQHNTFPLQFGSLSPGFQIPRTSLAPSNLEGPISKQAQHHLFKSVPSGTVLPVPRQPIAKSDSKVCDKLNIEKSNPEPETKREMQMSVRAPLNQNQKPSVISHTASIESMSLGHQISNAANVNEVQVHDSISTSSAAKDVAILPPLGSLRQVIDSRPKESLSSSNLIKANKKVSGNKELIKAIGSQGKIQRIGSSSDRWQRDTNFQMNGLISPTQLQMKPKTENKYEVGKVADEEETKQRKLKAILNKLTPQNFEKLYEQVIAVNIDNSMTLCGVIFQIFDKALMEPTYCEMYANLCQHLAGDLPHFSFDNEKITFKRLLLNKCQEEFERDQVESDEINKVCEMQSSEEQEAKRLKARRRMLGNIRLIGELYKKKMMTKRIMHEHHEVFVSTSKS